MTALIWTMLAMSVLLTWVGVRQSSPAPLLVAAVLSTIGAVPLAWSIGPLVLLMAGIQLGYGLALRQSLHWWTPAAIVSAMLVVWFTTIIVGATLLDR